MLFVRYEDTVNRPDETVAGISRFCGISPGQVPKDGDWEKSRHADKIPQHARWRTYLSELSSKPISSKSIGSYETVFTAADCAMVDQRCQAIRKRFNYV